MITAVNICCLGGCVLFGGFSLVGGLLVSYFWLVVFSVDFVIFASLLVMLVDCWCLSVAY